MFNFSCKNGIDGQNGIKLLDKYNHYNPYNSYINNENLDGRDGEDGTYGTDGSNGENISVAISSCGNIPNNILVKGTVFNSFVLTSSIIDQLMYLTENTSINFVSNGGNGG